MAEPFSPPPTPSSLIRSVLQGLQAYQDLHPRAKTLRIPREHVQVWYELLALAVALLEQEGD